MSGEIFKIAPVRSYGPAKMRSSSHIPSKVNGSPFEISKYKSDGVASLILTLLKCERNIYPCALGTVRYLWNGSREEKGGGQVDFLICLGEGKSFFSFYLGRARLFFIVCKAANFLLNLI